MPRKGTDGVWQRTLNCAELYDSSKGNVVQFILKICPKEDPAGFGGLIGGCWRNT